MKKVELRKILEFDAEVYINSKYAISCNNLNFPIWKKEWIKKVAEMNGASDFEFDDLMINVVFSSDELITKSLANGITIEDTDGKETFIQPWVDFLPAILFSTGMEGDKMVIRIPYHLSDDNDIEIIINGTLSQKANRYDLKFQNAFLNAIGNGIEKILDENLL